MAAAGARPAGAEVSWAGVRVLDPVILPCDPANPGVVRRVVRLVSQAGKPLAPFEELVWPVWVPAPDSDTTTADFGKQWADASAQARSASKWIATVLGAALAALIGSAPLAGLRDVSIPWYAYLYGGAGLVLVVLTLFLVLRVLVPRVTGFDDLTGDSLRFRELKNRVESHCGALLPTGITSLGELAGRAQLEARTLSQLAGLLAKGTKPALNPGRQGHAAQSLLVKSGKPSAHIHEQWRAALMAAQAGRAQWLAYLTQTITQWTAVASYQDVKKRAGLARFLGLVSGTVGTALIVAAFLVPAAKTPAVSLATYRIAKDGVAAAAAQSAIGGAGCATFKGIVVDHDAHDNVTVLVQPDGGCNAASITVPGKDLVRIAGS